MDNNQTAKNSNPPVQTTAGNPVENKSAEAKSAETKSAETKPVKGKEKSRVSITAKVDGFRRCGIEHPATTVTYEEGRFTSTEIEMLQKEPKLVVHVH
jgi:hypothetical protein